MQFSKDDVPELSVDTGISEDEIITTAGLFEKEDEKLLKKIRKTAKIEDLYIIAFNEARAGSIARIKAFEKWLSILKLSDGKDPFYWVLQELTRLWNYVPDGSEIDRKVIEAINDACLEKLEEVSNIAECGKIYKYTLEESEARKQCILKAIELYEKLTFSF